MKALRKLIAVTAAATLTFSQVVAAEWPEKPVTIVVPFAVGGSTDVLTRAVGAALEKRIGHPVLVENRPGAGGSVGSAYVAAAPADGYTFMLGTTGTHAINPQVYKNIRYDPVKDFAPIIPFVDYSLILVADPKSGIKTIDDLIAKAKTSRVTYGSSGIGASNHMLTEMLAKQAGVTMTHVPYKADGAALVDVSTGVVTFLLTTLSTARAFRENGSVIPVATTGKTRNAETPEVPTISETIPGFELEGWLGYLAPDGTPAEIVTRLNKELAEIARLPEMAGVVAGFDIPSYTPEQFAERIKADNANWANIVKTIGIKLEQ